LRKVTGRCLALSPVLVVKAAACSSDTSPTLHRIKGLLPWAAHPQPLQKQPSLTSSASGECSAQDKALTKGVWGRRNLGSEIEPQEEALVGSCEEGHCGGGRSLCGISEPYKAQNLQFLLILLS
jgi:hypothetical protein